MAESGSVTKEGWKKGADSISLLVQSAVTAERLKQKPGEAQ